MALTLQNLRAVSPGVEPNSLLPGQLCFNVADRIMYVGDGSDYKTNFNGIQVSGVPGEGWYSMPMNFENLNDYYIINPEYYGNIPQNRYTLTWNSTTGYAVWAPVGGNVFPTTNAVVDAASGLTITEKLNNIVGVPPLEGDTVIVVGLPGDAYEGLYIFDGGVNEWLFAAHYAFPEAQDVPYDNAVSGLTATTVQSAIDEVATEYIPRSAFTAAGDLLVGSGVSSYVTLPAGPTNYILQSNGNGTLTWVQNSPGDVNSVTGTFPILVDNTNPQSPVIEINAASVYQSGAVLLNDTVTSTSITEAATANAVKTTYDLADDALPKSGGTMTGFINFADNQLVDAGTF